MKVNIVIFFLLIFSASSFSQKYLNKEHLFDDFKYSKITFPAKFQNSNSMFGVNPWVTKAGSIQTEAWRRYSFNDPDFFGEKMTLTIDSIGFNMTMESGFDKNVGYLPTVNSNFLISEGTVASRIKFPVMTKTDKMNHAFFLWSPVMLKFNDFEGNNNTLYWSEMDFEYNNCFFKDDEARIKIGCNNYDGKYVLDRNVDCIVRKNGEYISFKDCVGELDGKDLISENWMIYIFRINKLARRIEFGIISDDQNLDFEIWGGHTFSQEGWNKFAYIDNYFPQYLLQTFYSIGACSNPQFRHTISVDWYYYSPNPELSHSEILSRIEDLRENKVERINTTNIPTFVETAELAQDNISISGPISAITCSQAEWKIEPHYKGRHFYRIKFEYRIFKDNSVTDWLNIERPEFYYTPLPSEDSIQLRLIYKDEWIPPADTVYYSCIFEQINCKGFIRDFEISSIMPNPVSDEFNVRLLISSETNLKVDIFDMTGTLVKNIYNKETNVGITNIVKNVSELSQGVYYIRVKSDKFIDDRMFVVIK